MNKELLEIAKKAAEAWKNTEGYTFASDLISQLCAEIESPRVWTPCAEGLPRRGEVVLVSYLKGDKEAIAVSEWIGVYGWAGMYDQEAVIAWMPCPAPYRADDTTGKVKEDAE